MTMAMAMATVAPATAGPGLGAGTGLVSFGEGPIEAQEKLQPNSQPSVSSSQPAMPSQSAMEDSGGTEYFSCADSVASSGKVSLPPFRAPPPQMWPSTFEDSRTDCCRQSASDSQSLSGVFRGDDAVAGSNWGVPATSPSPWPHLLTSVGAKSSSSSSSSSPVRDGPTSACACSGSNASHCKQTAHVTGLGSKPVPALVAIGSTTKPAAGLDGDGVEGGRNRGVRPDELWDDDSLLSIIDKMETQLMHERIERLSQACP
mmetsp:Transcript_51297/g.111322  ORF Transcript_51297/g.111322 Transcript_51297/m.111322 type:complete len:259 (+) Transcript_51297:24-800(+)